LSKLAPKSYKQEQCLNDFYIVAAANFDPEYLMINPMGTVPSLVVPSLSKPLTDSRDVLNYLDEVKTPSLTPSDPKLKAIMDAIVSLVHSDDVGTDLILLQARDVEELNGKRTGGYGDFIAVRQKVLENNHTAYPDHPFYGPKAIENGALHNLYTTKPSAEHEAFFKETQAGYVRFAAEVDRLETLLVLPYAAGEQVTHADLHAVPWLAHAMAGVGTKEIGDLSTMEAHIQKSVPEFKFGPKLQKWWENYTSRAAFKEVFLELH
jgi:glutathione S-transferase